MSASGHAVIDTSTLILYFDKQRNFLDVADHFREASKKNSEVLLSLVNFGEVYYIYHRRKGAQKAEDIHTAIRSLPIQVVAPDLEVTKQAAVFKSTTPLSYVDCFAAALASVRGLPLVTADREFTQAGLNIKVALIK